MLKNISLFVLLSLAPGHGHDDGLAQKSLSAAEEEWDRLLERSGREFAFDMPGHDRFDDKPSEMEKLNFVVQKAAERMSTASDEKDLQILQSRLFTDNDLCSTEANPDPCGDASKASVTPSLAGNCNNLNKPVLGMKNRPFRRLLPPCDRDIMTTRDTLLHVSNRLGERFGGFNSGSSCDTKNPLPNARLVSRVFHTDENVPCDRTILFPIFGQFVSHDNILTVTQKAVTDCCSIAGLADKENCLSIIVPDGDAFFSKGKCLPMSRAVPFCNSKGSERTYVNGISAYLDAGNIYGSDLAISPTLRTKVGGQMKLTENKLLPILDASASPKHVGGDGRAMENPALAALNTIFVREHNRLATLIAQADPNMNDNQVYYKARRIVTAVYQNIIYSEFLPLLIGSKTLLPPGTLETQYDPNVDPSTTNEFAAAAFRFGHSMLNAYFTLNNPVSGWSYGSVLLRTTNYNESIYESSPDMGMTGLIKGMTLDAAQMHDTFVTAELTNYLHASPSNNFAFGADLVARNIQRGRDLGLPGWIFYRKGCGQPLISSWADKPNDVSAEMWSKLQSLYTSPADIDLFTGSLAESPVADASLGITSKCIVEDQFTRLLKGDRYFFAHPGSSVGMRLNANQIEAVRQISLFDIICLNTDIARIQKNVFLTANPGSNPMTSCKGAKAIDVKIML